MEAWQWKKVDKESHLGYDAGKVAIAEMNDY